MASFVFKMAAHSRAATNRPGFDGESAAGGAWLAVISPGANACHAGLDIVAAKMTNPRREMSVATKMTGPPR